LSKNDAYGEVNEDAIVELPKHVFLVDGKFDEELIAVGKVVPMMSSNGQRMNGQVLDINDETIKMDFNHPLAGEDLFFTGKVFGVREASEEELAGSFRRRLWLRKWRLRVMTDVVLTDMIIIMVAVADVKLQFLFRTVILS
jgi:FKBP-type peptidyl-prolyl cis-trans isomerase 2